MKFFFTIIFGIFFNLSSISLSFAVSLENIQNNQLNIPNLVNSVDSSIIKPNGLPELDVSETATSIPAAQSLFFKAMDMILIVAGIISVMFIIVGGFMYVINAGNEDLQTKAKNTILYAVFGLLLIFISYTVIENTIRYLYNEAEQQQYNEINELPVQEFMQPPIEATPK